MKKLVIVVALAALFAACDNLKEKNSQLQAEKDSLMLLLSQRSGEFDDMMKTVNAIQDGFRKMNELQNRIDLQSREMEGVTPSQAMLDDMQYMLNTLAEYKAKIAQLQQQLRSSGNKSTELQRIIDNLQVELKQKEGFLSNLQEELEQKNIRIAELDEQVSGLQSDVETLSTENAQQAQVVAAQDLALNTAWFVFGSSKELKEQNILKKGDVLTSSEFNKDYFTEVDIRVMTEIPLYSKSAKLLTTHPTGSYSLEKDAKGLYTLKVENIADFWSVSRYLVILVK